MTVQHLKAELSQSEKINEQFINDKQQLISELSQKTNENQQLIYAKTELTLSLFERNKELNELKIDLSRIKFLSPKSLKSYNSLFLFHNDLMKCQLPDNSVQFQIDLRKRSRNVRRWSCKGNGNG